MKILILGGTQFFGKEIVRQAVRANHEITTFTRGNRKPTDLPPHGSLLGDRNNLADLERAAKADKWDVVIDNTAYTATDVKAAVKAFAGVGHYILCSSVSVYRFIPHRYCQPMKEQDVSFDFKPPEENPSDIHWKYARGKLEAERECAKQRKVPWTILRPPVVYGPDDPTERGFWYVGRLLHGGPLLLADGGVQSFRLIASADTAAAFLQAAENHRKTLRKIYFIGQKEIITLKDFIEESARALGVVPDYVDVPRSMLGEMGGPFANMVNLIPDISAAIEDFGFSPTPLPSFAKATAQWFRDQWHGDEDRLLHTRKNELEFAAQWRKLKFRQLT